MITDYGNTCHRLNCSPYVKKNTAYRYRYVLTSFVPGVSGGPDGAVGELEEQVGPLVAGVDLDEGMAAVAVLDLSLLLVLVHPGHLGVEAGLRYGRRGHHDVRQRPQRRILRSLLVRPRAAAPGRWN